MVHCVPKSKHVKLTLACYPKSKSAAAHPNSSELQYLAYYASSRPKKLIKVGHYIRQKAAKDAYWNRQTDVVVSIDICAALIEKCHNNLNLFAGDAIQVINSALVLATKDIMILDHAVSCFVGLTRYMNESLLATDDTFAQQYRDALSVFSKLSVSFNAEEDLKATTLCLDALQAAASSKGLVASNTHGLLATLMTPALKLLHACTEDVLYSLRADIQRRSVDLTRVERRPSLISAATNRPRESIIEDSNDTAELAHRQVQISALQILRTVFDTNDALQVRNATNTLLVFFKDCVMQDNGWASTIIQFVAGWTPINLRFHILGICLQDLAASHSAAWPEPHQSALLYLIHGLLTSKVSLIGLSTIDVLESLMSYAKSLTSNIDGEGATKIMTTLELARQEETSGTTEPRIDFVARFVRTTGSISSHTYYQNQVSDLCKTIIGNIMPGSASLDPGQVLFSFLQLEVLSTLMKGASIPAVPGESHQSIPLHHWLAVSTMLEHPDRRLRMEFVDVFLQYLHSKFLCVFAEDVGDPAFQHGIKQLQVTLFKSFATCRNDASELLSWHILVKTLAMKLGRSTFAGFVPMLYFLLAQEDEFQSTISAMITLILSATAEQYHRDCLSPLLQIEMANALLASVVQPHNLECSTVTHLIQRPARPSNQLSSSELVLPPLQTVVGSLTNISGPESPDAELSQAWTPETQPSIVALADLSAVSRTSVRISTMPASRLSVEPDSSVVSSLQQGGHVNDIKAALSTPASATHADVASTHHVADLLVGIEMEALR